MAIGDTVNAGLMRIDTSAIERAGQANAKANQAFGLALGEVAKGYFVGQEKKARANEIKEELMGQGVPEDAAGNISKNPFLQKKRARQEAAAQQMNIAKMQDATFRANSGAQLAQKAAFQQDARDERDLIRAKGDEFEKYLGTPSPSQIDPTGPGRFDVLRNLREGKGVTPPARMIPGASPAEEMLMSPEAKSFARRAVEGGQPMSLVMPMAQKIDSQIAAQTPKPPTRSEDLNERKFQRQIVNEDKENQPMPPVDAVYKESALAAIDTAIDKSKLFFATGVTGQVLSNFASTDAKDLSAAISTVEAAVGFDRLQDMRDASKTGGALGAINTKELQLLSASLGSLDPLQKPETLRANLDSIRERYVKIIKSIEAEKYAYKEGLTFETPKQAMEFVEQFNASPQSQNANAIDPSAPASPATLQALEKKRQLRSNRAGL